jgi:SSS family solute:Na+ symporter
MIIYGITENLRSLLADQNYVQKYCSVPTEREAKRSVWIAMLIYIPLTAIFLYIGTTLFAFYSQGDELVRAGIDKGDKVFPYFIATQVPAGLKGLIIAAIIAAAMSTVDSALNCSATVLLIDVYKRYFKPTVSEKSSMTFLRVSTVIWGIMGTGAALWMIKAKSILDVWWQISGIFGGAFLGLFLLSFMRVRLKLWHGLVSIGVSVIVISWGTFMRESFFNKAGLQIPQSLKWTECNLEPIIIGAVGSAALMIVAIIFGLIDPKRDIQVLESQS